MSTARRKTPGRSRKLEPIKVEEQLAEVQESPEKPLSKQPSPLKNTELMPQPRHSPH